MESAFFALGDLHRYPQEAFHRVVRADQGEDMPTPVSFLKRFAALLMMPALGGMIAADETRKVSTFENLQIAKKPIDYWASDSRDPVARLARRIENDGLVLEASDRFGYLPAVLKELDIPVDSQLLRFSSDGLNRLNTTAQQPRALYFDDDTVVAWFPETEQLEIASQDAQKGTLYYTLKNRREARPKFERVPLCMACHNTDAWQMSGIAAPGHLIRSFLTDDETRKHPLGTQVTDALPIELRWNGQYISGASATQVHRGNSIWATDGQPARKVTNFSDEFDTSRYLVDTSDVVAHLVFDHQMYGQNLLSRLSYEHQTRVRSKIETMVVRYLLVVDAVPLDRPTLGKSAYVKWYLARGTKDPQGRSLYDLELETRLFHHRVSPLIQSKMVANFPPELKRSLFARLNNLLKGREELKGYSVPLADRLETLSVLRATVPDWPTE